MKKLKIYLASPWFNDEQHEREEFVKETLRSKGYEVLSPLEMSECMPNASKQERKKSFLMNINMMLDSDIIFAITDGKDTGTIWEAGFINGYNVSQILLNQDKREKIGNEKKVIYYCETLNGNPFNLMLAESADLIIAEETVEKTRCLLKKVDLESEENLYEGTIE